MTKKKINKVKTENKKRSIGLSLVISIIGLYSLVLLYLNIITLAVLSKSGWTSIHTLFITAFVISIISLVGLIKYKNWGKILTVLLLLALLIKLIIDYSIGNSNFAPIDLIYILILLGISGYLLFSKSVKEAFN